MYGLDKAVYVLFDGIPINTPVPNPFIYLPHVIHVATLEDFIHYLGRS
jgi:hypothetical protein